MSLSLQTDKTQLKTDEIITFSGQLLPVLPKVGIILTITDPNGEKQTITTITNHNGTYSYQYIPNINGTYAITATYQTNPPITSVTLTFNLNESTHTQLPITHIPPYVYFIIGALTAALIMTIIIILTSRKRQQTPSS